MEGNTGFVVIDSKKGQAYWDPDALKDKGVISRYQLKVGDAYCQYIEASLNAVGQEQRYNDLKTASVRDLEIPRDTEVLVCQVKELMYMRLPTPTRRCATWGMRYI